MSFLAIVEVIENGKEAIAAHGATATAVVAGYFVLDSIRDGRRPRQEETQPDSLN